MANRAVIQPEYGQALYLSDLSEDDARSKHRVAAIRKTKARFPFRIPCLFYVYLGMEESIKFLKDRIAIAEKAELYEVCAKMHNILEAIEAKDEQAYINLVFNIEALESGGFFDEQNTPEEYKQRILRFFGLKNIFEYSLIDNLSYICER